MQIIKEFESVGIKQFSNNNVDKDYLEMPMHIDELPMNEVQRYLHACIQQRMYVRSLHAQLKLELVPLSIKLKQEKSRVFSTFPPRMSVADKEAHALDDGTFFEVYKDVQYLQGRITFLEEYLDSLDDMKFNVSRELTRRGIDLSDSVRDSRVGRG